MVKHLFFAKLDYTPPTGNTFKENKISAFYQPRRGLVCKAFGSKSRDGFDCMKARFNKSIAAFNKNGPSKRFPTKDAIRETWGKKIYTTFEGDLCSPFWSESYGESFYEYMMHCGWLPASGTIMSKNKIAIEDLDDASKPYIYKILCVGYGDRNQAAFYVTYSGRDSSIDGMASWISLSVAAKRPMCLLEYFSRNTVHNDSFRFPTGISKLAIAALRTEMEKRFGKDSPNEETKIAAEIAQASSSDSDSDSDSDNNEESSSSSSGSSEDTSKDKKANTKRRLSPIDLIFREQRIKNAYGSAYQSRKRTERFDKRDLLRSVGLPMPPPSPTTTTTGIKSEPL